MKIELTPQEVELLEAYLRGEYDCPTDEIKEFIGKLAERALEYERATKSEDDPDDLLAWYYEQYKAQQ